MALRHNLSVVGAQPAVFKSAGGGLRLWKCFQFVNNIMRAFKCQISKGQNEQVDMMMPSSICTSMFSSSCSHHLLLLMSVIRIDGQEPKKLLAFSCSHWEEGFAATITLFEKGFWNDAPLWSEACTQPGTSELLKPSFKTFLHVPFSQGQVILQWQHLDA